jgi:hypothetical protein
MNSLMKGEIYIISEFTLKMTNTMFAETPDTTEQAMRVNVGNR